MGYFDFPARFDVALFDRSSFDFLGHGITGIVLPLNVTIEVPSYSINMEVPTYNASVSVPDYEVDVSIG